MGEYFNPVRIVMGAGALAQLPQLLAGRRAVLVTIPEARGLGWVERIEAMLGDRLVGVIDKVQPNPDVAQLRHVYDGFWRHHERAEAIVALGGGSAIDTAKALMVGTATRTFDELMEGLSDALNFMPARCKTLIAIPSTAGTGSEVTPWATIWDRAAQKKHSLHLAHTWPGIALIDPELMLSLPAGVTLQSALDALSHALESIWNVNANPVSDDHAVAAIHDIFETLPRLMTELRDLELRSRMATAALRAGLAFSNTRTALAHSISYAMTLKHGLPHGIACSFTLPMVLERAIGQRPERDTVLERALGPLDRAPARLTHFIEGLGVSTRFVDYGVGESDATAMVAHAMTGARGQNFIGALTQAGQLVASAPPHRVAAGEVGRDHQTASLRHAAGDSLNAPSTHAR